LAAAPAARTGAGPDGVAYAEFGISSSSVVTRFLPGPPDAARVVAPFGGPAHAFRITDAGSAGSLPEKYREVK